jgi:hypothetical protein
VRARVESDSELFIWDFKILKQEIKDCCNQLGADHKHQISVGLTPEYSSFYLTYLDVLKPKILLGIMVCYKRAIHATYLQLKYVFEHGSSNKIVVFSLVRGMDSIPLFYVIV